jgi:hypothetical protein
VSEFKVENADGQVRLSGVIDEHADLSFLSSLVGPKVVMNLRGVRRINSYGVRHWMEHIRKVPPSVQMEVIEIPPPIVDQVNMVHGFMGRGKVVSFYVPYTCGNCEEYREQLVTSSEVRAKKALPEVKCPACDSVMEVDDVEEQYLQILRDA